MGVTREQVMGALIARIQAVCTTAFKTYSRKFFFYDELVALLAANAPGGVLPDFPLICIYDGIGFGGGVNTWTPRRGVPVTRDFSVTLVIYARKDFSGTPQGADYTQVGMSILTPLIEQVEAAMQPDDPSLNTLTLVSQLGQINKVAHCWLEGAGHSIPGDTDEQGIAMQTIPVRILLP